MVNPGQFVERPAIIAAGGCVLDGLWHRGAARPPLLIVPPLPSQGRMHHPVLAELAWAAATAGFPTLRFDFRGVGASQGGPGGPPERLTDAEAALRLLEEMIPATDRNFDRNLPEVGKALVRWLLRLRPP